MQRNSIKIISNKRARTISYYIKNEADEWIHVDSSSPLSRKEYTETSIHESAEKIIEVIDDIYNTGNRGLNLEIECANDEFIYLSSKIEKNHGDANISSTQIQKDGVRNEPKKGNSNILYKQNKMQVAFAGKIGSGKTTLIDALAELNNIKFCVSYENNYALYQNIEGNQLWYDIKGIDIGKINVEKAYITIKSLIKVGVNVLIYCFSALTNKIEITEKNILFNIKSDFPNVRILAVLTSCVDDDGTVYAERMSNFLNGIKVLPVLAKDKKIRNGIITAYGLEEISRFIYGGK